MTAKEYIVAEMEECLSDLRQLLASPLGPVETRDDWQSEYKTALAAVALARNICPACERQAAETVAAVERQKSRTEGAI